MTLAEYAAALATVPASYAGLPKKEVRSAAIGDVAILLAHPSSQPIIYRDGVWYTLTPPGAPTSPLDLSAIMTSQAIARDEILRILAERYLSSLTPGTPAAQELNRLMVAANLWRPPPAG